MSSAILTINSRNYGAWSLRGWLMCRFSGLDFTVEERDANDPSQRDELLLMSPSFLVPCLTVDGLEIWDTLAIAEYLAEKFPQLQLWPSDPAQRARARSVVAEMHAGFGALRNAFGMNIEASLPEIGAKVLREQPQVRADVDRIVQMWTELLQRHGGPLLFGRFTIADAFYAPVVTRFITYAVPLPAPIAAYMDRVLALPSVAAWRTAALAEQTFVPFDEPYRTHR